MITNYTLDMTWKEDMASLKVAQTYFMVGLRKTTKTSKQLVSQPTSVPGHMSEATPHALTFSV